VAAGSNTSWSNSLILVGLRAKITGTSNKTPTQRRFFLGVRPLLRFPCGIVAKRDAG
jgi:hypothetical protein